MIVSGVDIGSLSTKAVIMINGEIRASAVILTGPDSTASAREVMELALKKAKLRFDDVQYTVATGYGRINVPFAQATVTEISCHAKGNHWLLPEVRTILDMGGQDCKAIRCDSTGKVTAFVMNDKCAAGTGRYLERVAETLGLALEEIGPLSLNLVNFPLPISSNCVVFAESEIVKLVREGKPVNDILAGACDALVTRIKGLLDRVGIEEVFCVSGGVAKNIGVVKRLEERVGAKAYIPPDPQLVGALGAALFAAEKAERTRDY